MLEAPENGYNLVKKVQKYKKVKQYQYKIWLEGVRSHM